MYFARRWVALGFGLMTTGCPLAHSSPPARAQEAATELNTHSRFGRMELAVERVSPSMREAFVARRKAWGASLRIADYEVTGFSMRGEHDADTLVKVSWYRVNESDLRTALLRQRWHDAKGDWQLVDETRTEGDAGLVDDAPLPGAPSTEGAAKGKNVQFPTIYLGKPDTQKSNEPAASGSPDRAGSP